MDADMIGKLAVAGLIWLVGYVLVCVVWPWGRCSGEYLGLHKCDAGRFYQSASRKSWRDCRKCKGTGKRRRFGRTLWAVFITAKREADGK